MILSIFSDEFFMKEALKEAKQSALEDEVPVGAIVVCGNRIIARAHNLTEKLNDVTAHAEMLAITASANYLGGKYLENCSIYITLEPCVMCAGALNHAHIGKIIWAADDPKKGFTIIGKNLLHPKTEISKGVCSHESEQLLKTFFAKKRS